jgi:hypothetical protein
MIEHRFFDLSKYKDLSEPARELDRLMMYEGFVVLCSVGKKNNVLLLRRILENPQELLSPPSNKSQGKKKEMMFPNAVR